MKKILTKLICTMLVVCMLCSSLIACANNNWSGSNLSLAPSKAGSLVENGGFIAETENYVYFINGKADAEGDNTLGSPIKGALYAADSRGGSACILNYFGIDLFFGQHFCDHEPL